MSNNIIAPTLEQIKQRMNQETWTDQDAKIIEDEEDNNKRKVKVISKEGYIFYITADKTEYIGKGEVKTRPKVELRLGNIEKDGEGKTTAKIQVIATDSKSKISKIELINEKNEVKQTINGNNQARQEEYFIVEESGIYKVRVTNVDSQERIEEITVAIDKIIMAKTPEEYVKEVKITIEWPQIAQWTNVVKEYKIGEGQWETYDETKEIKVSDNVRVYARMTNQGASQEISSYIDINNIDKTNPNLATIEVSNEEVVDNKKLLNEKVGFTLKGQDQESGVKAIELYIGEAKVWEKTTYNGEKGEISEPITFNDLSNLEETQVAFLNNATCKVKVIDMTENDAQSSVTVTDYTTKNAQDLVTLANSVNAITGYNDFNGLTITQVNEIDLSGDEDNQWQGIGYYNTDSDKRIFCGIYNGKGNKIKNIYINNTQDKLVSLFGYCKGTIKNLIASGTINRASVDRSFGGICGLLENGLIDNCTNEVNCTAKLNVGGICGICRNSTISNCINKGKITGKSETTGGICGLIPDEYSSSTIENCVNENNIEADCNVGGILGKNYGRVTSCINLGDVKSNATSFNTSGHINNSCGGITSFNGYTGTINKCYNEGKIEGYYERIGGIAGFNSNLIEECYNIGQVYNYRLEGPGGIGGIIGYLTNERAIVRYCYNLGRITISSSIGSSYGSIIGAHISSGDISYCYFLPNTANGNSYGINGATSSKNKAESKSEAEFKRKPEDATEENISVTALLNASKNPTIWEIDENGTINGGYPYLKDSPSRPIISEE